MSIDYLFCHLRQLMQVITETLSRYYVPNVRIKDINVLIDGKSFFDLQVKNEEEAYDKIIEMSRNNDYTTGNILDFGYFKENYRLLQLIWVNKVNWRIRNKSILLENLKIKLMVQQCFSSLKNPKKLPLNFYKILSRSYNNGNAKHCKLVRRHRQGKHKICDQKMVCHWQWIKR